MELSELIEGLSVPSAYPEPAESVELHQTHISLVFLAGPLAYKIKKPVNLGFLDYTTLERRRRFCEEEVRLNRRLAPSVYLGVVPVTRDGSNIRMGGHGTVVEWAVKMERLADSATLAAYLERREVGADSIEELARRLAEFHARAEGGAKVALGGSFEAVAGNARENFEQAAQHVGETLSESTYRRLRALTEAALEDLRDLIASLRCPRSSARHPWRPSPRPRLLVSGETTAGRLDRGRLHRIQRAVSPCRPDRRSRFSGDGAEARGRGDLADSFVETYHRAARDEEGRALLPFYRAYRAAVRGKVEGMKLAEPEVPDAEKSTARAKARARWLFALSELEVPRGRPCLMLLGGLPGSGKSTLAQRLGEDAGFTVIRSDVVRKELAAETQNGAARTPASEDFYTEEWNNRTYEACLRHADKILFEGGRVLIDASFQKESRRRQFLDAGREWGVAACLIVCQADPEVVRKRLNERQGDASDADWAVHLEIARRWEEPSPRTIAVTRRVDTSGSKDETARRGLEALREFGLCGGTSSETSG